MFSVLQSDALNFADFRRSNSNLQRQGKENKLAFWFKGNEIRSCFSAFSMTESPFQDHIPFVRCTLQTNNMGVVLNYAAKAKHQEPNPPHLLLITPMSSSSSSSSLKFLNKVPRSWRTIERAKILILQVQENKMVRNQEDKEGWTLVIASFVVLGVEYFPNFFWYKTLVPCSRMWMMSPTYLTLFYLSLFL